MNIQDHCITRKNKFSKLYNGLFMMLTVLMHFD